VNIKATLPQIVLQGVVLLLLVANALNIAADVGRRGSPNGRHHPAGLEKVCDGRFHRESAAHYPRLDSDGGHGRGGGADVYSRLGRPGGPSGRPAL